MVVLQLCVGMVRHVSVVVVTTAAAARRLEKSNDVLCHTH